MTHAIFCLLEQRLFWKIKKCELTIKVGNISKRPKIDFSLLVSTTFCRKWVEVMQISDRPAVETRRSVYGGVAGPRVTSSPVWPKFFRLVHTHTPRLWCSHPFSTFFRLRLCKKLKMDNCDIKLSQGPSPLSPYELADLVDMDNWHRGLNLLYRQAWDTCENVSKNLLSGTRDILFFLRKRRSPTSSDVITAHRW